MYLRCDHRRALWLLLLAACTESAPRPAPQPGPPASPPSAPDTPHTERGTLRLGTGPAKYRLLTDAQAPAEPPRVPAAEPPGFLGKPERTLLEQLRSGAVTAAKQVGGTFALTLDSGVQASFRPDSRVRGASWAAEVAAYYLDRALALGRVPPVVARRFAWPQLKAAAARQNPVVVDAEGQVRGALVLGSLGELAVVLPAGWESWIRAEPPQPTEVSPYQRSADYARALRERKPRGYQQPQPEPEPHDRPGELSDMLLFDFLTLNERRFDAPLLALGAAGSLVLLHNESAFSPGPARRSLLDARLAPLAKFRKRTVDALRTLDVPAFGARLAADPLGPFLDDSALHGLAERRSAVLEHVAAQERRYGTGVYLP